MKTVDLAKATASLRKYAEQADREVVVVTRRGKPMAAVVPVEDYDLESLSLSTNPKFLEIIAESRRSLKREGGIPIEEVRRRLGIPKARPSRQAAKKRDRLG
jgi:prevent-host-death family protein